MINVNKEFFYSGNHIIKLWEQHLKLISPNIKFYLSDEEEVDSIFYNGLQQTKEVAIVVNNDNTPYINNNGQTITLCGEINYTGNSASNNIAEAIKQILSYKQNAITNHIIVFPYHPSCFHWNLGKIELSIQENKINSAVINIYEPFGGQNNRGEDYLHMILKQLPYFNNTNIQTGKVKSLKQQNDVASCGVITAENGKKFLEQSNCNNLLTVIYPAGAEDLRRQHINQINDDNFYTAQLENKSYVAKGDQPIADKADILATLKLLVEKEINDWVKQIILTIRDIHNNIESNAEDNKNKNEQLELLKEFLIINCLTDAIEDNVIQNILKSNLEWQDGAIDVILTLAHSFTQPDKKIGINEENTMEKSSVIKLNSLGSTVNGTLENFSCNKPVTIDDIKSSQSPTYIISHLLASGFRGSDYQLLVLLDKLTEFLIKDKPFEAMVEVDGVGNLDDVVILTKNENVVTQVEAYQVKYYNHPITAHDFFNKTDTSVATKNNKMHIGKFLDGWLEWKNNYSNLSKEKINSIIYSNASLDNILMSCITPEGKFEENFIDGHQAVTLNRKSAKIQVVRQNFLTHPKNIKFSYGDSAKIWEVLSKKGFLDANGQFTKRYNPSQTDLLLESDLLGHRIKKESDEIILEIKTQLMNLYANNKVNFLELLFKEAFSYLDRKKKHKDVCSKDEVNRKKIFKKFLQSFKFHIEQNNIEKLEEKIQTNIGIILKRDPESTPYQVSTVYLCLYYAIRDWFRKEYSDKQAPKITNDLMLKLLQESLINTQDIILLHGHSDATLSHISYCCEGISVPRSELKELECVLGLPGLVMVTGEKGMGKSGLLKQVLSSRYQTEYLLFAATDLLSNNKLKEKLINVSNNLAAIRIIAIDGAESLLSLSDVELHKLLSNLQKHNRTVVLTLTADAYRCKFSAMKSNVIDMKLLSVNNIMQTFPQLDEYKSIERLINLAQVPFYLSAIIKLINQITKEELDYIVKSRNVNLESNLIKFIMEGQDINAIKIRRLGWQQLVVKIFNADATSSFFRETTLSDVPSGIELLKKEGIILFQNGKYRFSHDLYFEHALMRYWLKKWSMAVYEGKTYKFWNKQIPSFLSKYGATAIFEKWLHLYDIQLKNDIVNCIEIILSTNYYKYIIASMIVNHNNFLLNKFVDILKTKGISFNDSFDAVGHYSTTYILLAIQYDNQHALQRLLDNVVSIRHTAPGGLILKSATSNYNDETSKSDSDFCNNNVDSCDNEDEAGDYDTDLYLDRSSQSEEESSEIHQKLCEGVNPEDDIRYFVKNPFKHWWGDNLDKESVESVYDDERIKNNKYQRASQDQISYIHQAVIHDSVKCLSVLLDYCVNNKQQDVIQLVNNYDETPLHVGVLNNSIEPVKLLIEYSASIDIADDYGETPLHNAVYNDNEVMAELLLRHKANPNYLNKIGLSPFHIALTKLSLPMVKIFLEYGADLSCAPFKDISCMVVADLLDAVYNQCDNKHDKSKLEDFVLQLIEWLNFGYAYKDGYEHAVWGSKCKELNTKLLKVQLNQVKALMTLVEGRAQISKITPDFDYRDEETELAYTLTIGDGDTDKLTHLVYYILSDIGRIKDVLESTEFSDFSHDLIEMWFNSELEQSRHDNLAQYCIDYAIDNCYIEIIKLNDVQYYILGNVKHIKTVLENTHSEDFKKDLLKLFKEFSKYDEEYGNNLETCISQLNNSLSFPNGNFMPQFSLHTLQNSKVKINPQDDEDRIKSGAVQIKVG